MDLRLTDRLVAVTGASAGIGRAVALELAAAGARLVLAARDAGRLDETARLATEAGSPRVARVAGDMTTVDGVATLRRTVEAEGGLTGLVACVGSTPMGTFDEVDDDTWQLAFSTKFLASVRAMRMAADLMASTGGGRVVIVAGNAARDAPTGMVTSTAINAALAALVANAGKLLAPRGIGVVGLHPGPTRTARYDALLAHQARAGAVDPQTAEAALAARIPVGHPADPADVAAAAAYLVSPRAAHVVATCLTVDGGQTWG